MTSLAQYASARAALGKATKIEHFVPIKAEIEHLKLYAKQIKDQALLADASEFQMHMERRLGVVIIEAQKKGDFKPGRPKKGDSVSPFSEITLKEAGIDKRLSRRAQGRASISEEAFEATIDAMRERIASGRAKIIEAPLPGGARALMGDRVHPEGADYFPTPPFATRALFERVFPHLGLREIDRIEEPACGEGHIAEVLSEYAKNVIASDLYDYGYGAAGHDFLADDAEDVDPDWIITNPPFRPAEEFTLKAIARARVGVAMFVRLQWLESVGRCERLFKPHPPTLVAIFAERVPICEGCFDPEGGTATAYIWLIWIKGCDPQPPFWIPQCRDELERADDAERFTTHPVTRKKPVDEAGKELPHDEKTGEIIDHFDANIPGEEAA